jgi:hypothetical protein
MRTAEKFKAGWYRSEHWMRFWFFSAGVNLVCATFISRLYFPPQSLAAKLAFGAAFAISSGVLSMSFLRKSR